MSKPTKCELTGCGKPIHKYLAYAWGVAGLCKKHYEEEKQFENSVACIHVPREARKETK